MDAKTHFHIYRDARSEWRWKLVASNGQTVADSAEGYRRKDDCLHGIDIVKQSSNAPVEE